MSTRTGNPGASVLVLEAHEPTRLGLALLLRREPWIGRCVTAADEARAVELAAAVRPRVAIVDMSESGPFVGATCRRLVDASPGTRIVLTSRCASSPGTALRDAGAA